MAEPWPMKPSIVNGPGWWDVHDDMHVTHWDDEQSARRYAALPVLIALARRIDVFGEKDCVQDYLIDMARAALKAAGETP